jgi:acetyltransferase-like isoleucine patch superfamily enzyme
LKILPIEVIAKCLSDIKIQRCLPFVTIGASSKFYEEARVVNCQQDKSKIFIGENSHIRGDLVVFGSGGLIRLGNECFIGEGSRIWSAEEIVVGNNVLIAHNCNIIDTNSHEIDSEERAEGYRNILKVGFPKEKGNILTAPIYIDDHSWISFNATILKGVRIGKGAIVAANSVVTKDVEPFTMVAGNPAAFIKNLKS